MEPVTQAVKGRWSWEEQCLGAGSCLGVLGFWVILVLFQFVSSVPFWGEDFLGLRINLHGFAKKIVVAIIVATCRNMVWECFCVLFLRSMGRSLHFESLDQH